MIYQSLQDPRIQLVYLNSPQKLWVSIDSIFIQCGLTDHNYSYLMFEALVERLLNKILGQYIENFSAQNLSIGIWSGEVVLKNVVLKKDVIKRLNLPFRIRYSRLGCLKMNIPWKSLTSSKIEVLLEGFELIIEEIPQTEWVFKNSKIIQQRTKEIQSYCETVLQDFAKKAQKGKEGEQGYVSKLIVKILDNLQITIRDIHIRYQNDNTKYSFGVTLEELKLYTVNTNDKPEYIDRNKPQYINEPLRKKLELYNIGVYWNENAEPYKETQFQQKMSSTIAKRNQPNLQQNYIILLSSQAKLLQRQSGKQFVLPQIDLSIDLETLKIEITNNQLQQIITLAERLQNYTRMVKMANRHKLTQEEMKKNRDDFLAMFPQYYDGWGKNLSQSNQKRIEDILEKMQVENFTAGMKTFLQGKQKQRIMKEKKEKSKGWFSGPKELTPKQIVEIEKYLNDNFSEEVKIIKRPEDYHYINVNFKLTKLQVVIANTRSIIKEGIQSQFLDLSIAFFLRQGGFNVQMGLNDISIKLFKIQGLKPIEAKEVLYKMNRQQSSIAQKYLKMIIYSNPLTKKHLNTDIFLETSELMFVFDPKIITVATQFADLQLNQENKQAAIEKYGQIKEKTSNAVAQSIVKPVKKMIGVDVKFKAITVAVPFSPKSPNSACWGLNLGSVHFTTDEATLLRSQIIQTQPLQVYNMSLQQFSFRFYPNIEEIIAHRRETSKFTDISNAVIDNLDFDLRLQLFFKNTQQIPKIKVKATLPSFELHINNFTYEHLLKIGDCFEQQERIKQNVDSRITEKTEIMKKAAKIGIVHVKDGLTQIWKKYVAVMSENYIYIYLDKKDKEYAAYYYIKGATLDKYHTALDKEKPYYFRIKNKLNEVIFGFDKAEMIDDWITKINNLVKEEETSHIIEIPNPPSVVAPKTAPNQLNLIIEASIQQTKIRIYTIYSISDKVIELKISDISTKILLYECKKQIHLNLRDLELSDTLSNYKQKQLAYFLYTSRRNQNESLINIHISQVSKDHPDYQHIDSKIDVNFGTLTCNYKCETVQTLMKFFIKEAPPKVEESQIEQKSNSQQNIISYVQADEEIYTLQLNLKIAEISLLLINEKIKTTFGKIAIVDLGLYTGMSQKRMVLQGSLKELYYKDFTNYPYTILQEQQNYGEGRYLIAAQDIKENNMLEFNIQILKKLNNDGKSMLIDIKLANLTVYYPQQAVFRIITYLNTQMLPSFDTGPKQEKKKVQAVNDTKPVPTPMDLNVILTNISVFLEPDPSQPADDRQYFQLNIESISVKNEAIYREYVKSHKPVVLVENYTVKLTAMSMFIKFIDINGDKHKYKLTNNLDFTCSTDLIANPNYYIKEMGNDFENGLRVQCNLTSFFMRINHNDYNFIMKCLNWSITHNDGADKLMFDIPQIEVPRESLQLQKKDNFYLIVRMDAISVFLVQDDIPIVFLLLDQMTYTFLSGQDTDMDLTIKNLFGTAIQHDQLNKCVYEKGMFNALGYKKTHAIEHFSSINSLVELFNRRDQLSKIDSNTPFLSFKMSTSRDKSSIEVYIDELIIDVDIKILLILTNLANADENYIKGPKPVVEIEEIKQMNEEKPKEVINNVNIHKRSSLIVKLNKLLGSVSDRKKQKFIILQGAIEVTMLNYGQKPLPYLEKELLREQAPDQINHSNIILYLNNFSLYFCNIQNKQIKNRREILKPTTIYTQIVKLYHTQKEFIVLATDIKLNIQQLLFVVSMKDIKNVDVIMKDNLAVLSEQGEKDGNKKEEKEMKVIEQQIKEIQQKIGKELQTSLKLKGKVKPLQLDLVNDCNSNFMPVLRFIMQQTEPYMHKFLIKTHIVIVPVISLLFFNPRSSKWEPIIQAFKASIDYLILVTKDGETTKFLVQTNSQETGSLKVNVSTQMISTLLAAQQIAKVERLSIQSAIQLEEIEISPYIFQNLTNQTVYLERGANVFQIPPLFKGPIRLASENEIVFRIGKHTNRFTLDHYGVLKIPQTKYLIQYDSERLNRIIKFLPQLIIKNCMNQVIYIKREGKVKQAVTKVQIGDFIPLDNVQNFSISLNGVSYTEKASVNHVKMISFLISQNKKYLILLRHKQKINKFSVIQIIPPFVIHNCLPKAFNLQFILKAKTITTKILESQRSHQVCASEDVSKLEFKLMVPGYTWTKKFGYKTERSAQQLQLELEDQQNSKTIINYQFSRNKETNQYILLIYCKKIIINEINEKLIIYGNQVSKEKDKEIDRYSLLGGQMKNDKSFNQKIMMVGQEVGNKIRVCGVNSIVDFATPILIGGLGSSQSRIVVDRVKQGKHECLFTVIGVEISLMKISKDHDIFCKKIILRNQSILINKTKYEVSIQEEGCNNFKFTVPADTKQSFVYGMPDIAGKTRGVIIESNNYKSKSIILPAQGSIYYKLFSKTEKDEEGRALFVYQKISVKQIKSYITYQLEEIIEDDLPYEVVVHSENLKVKVPSAKRLIGKGQSCRFINENTGNNEHELVLEVSYQDSTDPLFLKLCPDNLNYRKTELLRIQKDNLVGSIAIDIYVTFSDKKKIVNIDEKHRAAQIKDVEKNYILLNLNELVLSINQNSQSVEVPYESIVLTMKKLCFIKNQSIKTTQYQLRLGFLQIDQAYPHLISNPVIITPYKFQQFTKENNPKFIFNSVMVMNNQFKENTFINEIAVDFNDIVVKFSADFINIMTTISKEFAEVINYKEEKYYITTKLEEWREMQIPKQGNKTFIKAIRIAPFVMDLSVELKINKLNLQNNELLSTLLSAIGVVMSNIDGAPIVMNGIEITDCIDTVETITNELISRYKSDCTAQLYKVFGSLNIIGNPMSLFKNISTGIKDLKDKPAQGFVNGPAEFGLGIAEGTRSLIAHSVGGAFNSLSGITGTVSTGLATLAFDKQFEQHREKEKMKKPQNIIQGLQKGGKAIFHGFKEGITGVFLQPYQNARQQGALGFVKGTAKGLAGLVVKPVTGIIDFASKTTEGIKNQALKFQDKPNESRMRYPRVFYTQCYIMREYCLIDSQLFAVIKKFQTDQKFDQCIYHECFAAEGGRQYLIVLQSNVAYVDVQKRKLRWAMSIGEIRLQNQKSKKLLYFKGERSSILRSNEEQIMINSDETRERIVSMIVGLQKERIENQ